MLSFIQNSSAEEDVNYVSSYLDNTFDRNGMLIASLGLIMATSQQSLDQKALTSYQDSPLDIPESYLGAASYTGTGIPNLLVMGAQFLLGDSDHAMAHIEGLGWTVAVTELLKKTTRRRRPNGQGFSFPSSHVSMAFATATSVYMWGGWEWGLFSYALASFVGFERFHDSRHWASDVLVGATIGIIFSRGASSYTGSIPIQPIVMQDLSGQSLAGLGWRMEY